jgi:CcmD family protein
MTYLLAAYAVFWLGVFVLVLRINSREAHLQQEIEALREFLESEKR